MRKRKFKTTLKFIGLTVISIIGAILVLCYFICSGIIKFVTWPFKKKPKPAEKIKITETLGPDGDMIETIEIIPAEEEEK